MPLPLPPPPPLFLSLEDGVRPSEVLIQTREFGKSIQHET